MGFSIVKVYRESLPNLKFIGKKYVDADRVDGLFGARWGEWFENGWFNKLEKEIEMLPKENEGAAYLGFMQFNDEVFEYWIGMFAAENSPVPLGFEYINLPAGDIATAWIHGREDNGEIYGIAPHNACVDKFVEKGWRLNEKYSVERYQCPRFTNADKDGKVILDYCIYIK
ncbi:MAG: hypothetical protein FWH10_01655 [Oscillospiraceae bacterium]|nr:hypothetical protein [Oscillospiraceae bacterium]